MHSSISRADLQILLHEADIAARRLVRQLRLPRADLDDVRQDLLVDLIARLPAYDADRGTLGAFAGSVLTNRATRIANKVKRERRMYGATPISLDEVIPDSDGLTRGGLIAEADGLSALFGQPADAFASAEERLDVERGLGSLEPADCALCAALSRATADRLAASGHGARSSLYRRVKDIRLALTAIGVHAA
ncbi:MAG: sigma factor [Parvibaculum sp.]|jgi:RNA polymerase sigma-70 factor (ECF subfamily)|uniref:sigma factor n=1 Tax=Hyphomicrobiales TaxID=356 RepID=UPI0023E45C2F|nr:sigma factor [Chelatococcus sp. XZ-Ab1]